MNRSKPRFPVDSPEFLAIAGRYRDAVEREDPEGCRAARAELDAFAAPFGVGTDRPKGRHRKDEPLRNYGVLRDVRYRIKSEKKGLTGFGSSDGETGLDGR